MVALATWYLRAKASEVWRSLPPVWPAGCSADADARARAYVQSKCTSTRTSNKGCIVAMCHLSGLRRAHCIGSHWGV